MNLSDFGIDSATLAGPLAAKLRVTKAAGFSRIMLWAKDLVGHPDGLDTAVALVKQSGIHVTGIQAMHDYEGLTGTLHDYKIDVAKNMLQLCRAVGAPLLMVCSSTSSHASGDLDLIARDLAKLANLAVPLGIRIGYEAVPRGIHVNDCILAAEVVDMANHANIGIVLNSFTILAQHDFSLEAIADIPSHKIALVQLADFMWTGIRSQEEVLKADSHLRVFPGEGEHSKALSEMVRRLFREGYRGEYSFEVFNDDYLQMPPEVVATHARRAAKWVTDQVLRRSLQVREKT